MYLFSTSLSQLTNSVHGFTFPPSFFPFLPSPSFFSSICAFIQAGYIKCTLFADFCIYRHQWGSRTIVHIPSLLTELLKGLFLNFCFHSPLSFHPLPANLLSISHIVTKSVFWKTFLWVHYPLVKKQHPPLIDSYFPQRVEVVWGWGWGEALLLSSPSSVFSVDVLLPQHGLSTPAALTRSPPSVPAMASQCYALVILSLTTNTLLTIYQYKFDHIL